MQKYKLWLLFFIGLFSFAFGMIIWTIVKTTSSPIQDDNSFLAAYHDVDRYYNEMMNANKSFLHKYDAAIILNGNEIDFSLEDINYSQRVMEKKDERKGLLNYGDNTLSLKLQNTQGKNIENADIKLEISRTGDNLHSILLKEFSYKNGKYTSNAVLDIKGRWNITGVVKTQEEQGYFFIKTTTK